MRIWAGKVCNFSHSSCIWAEGRMWVGGVYLLLCSLTIPQITELLGIQNCYYGVPSA
ncbi:mCG148212 [Mus musculus]|nr:mCG148212 [Mus musculus]